MNDKQFRGMVERIILTRLAAGGERFVPVAVSARHVHLSQGDIDRLFYPGYRLRKLRDLVQPGQYACQERVALETPKGRLMLRVLGPPRGETQVELSVGDTVKLGLPPVIRMSGELDGTPGGILVNGDKQLELPRGIIVARRHLHISSEEAAAYGIRDGDTVSLAAEGERPSVFHGVLVRAGKEYVLEAHIDQDEANAAALGNGALCRLLPESGGIETSPAKEPAPGKERGGRALVTEEDVKAAYKAGETRLCHPLNAIITPLARDAARAYGITLCP